MLSICSKWEKKRQTERERKKRTQLVTQSVRNISDIDDKQFSINFSIEVLRGIHITLKINFELHKFLHFNLCNGALKETLHPYLTWCTNISNDSKKKKNNVEYCVKKRATINTIWDSFEANQPKYVVTIIRKWTEMPLGKSLFESFRNSAHNLRWIKIVSFDSKCNHFVVLLHVDSFGQIFVSRVQQPVSGR